MISVIIPTYNRGRLIERSIRSVLNQSYSNLELIIVDDCSTDNTKEVIDGIKDERIRYIRLEEKHNADYARNIVIDEAKGEYVAFQDSDDFWHEDKLEKQLDFLIKNNADVVFCNMKRHLNGKFKDYYPTGIKEGQIHYEQLLARNLMSTQTIMGKNECFKEYRFDENVPRFDDWDLALRLSKKYAVYHQDEVLVDTYIQVDSLSNDPVILFSNMNHIYDKYSHEAENEVMKHNFALYRSGYGVLVERYLDLRKHYDELNLKKQEIEMQYDQVINSKFWKLSKPIRNLLDSIKRSTKK